jgi:hypothetical protein
MMPLGPFDSAPRELAAAAMPPSLWTATADGGRFRGHRTTLPCITASHLSQPGKSLDFARYQQEKAHRKERDH